MKNNLKKFLKHLKKLGFMERKKCCRLYILKSPPSILELESPNYSTLCNRAETFEKLKRYDEALNDLNRVITAKPHKSTARCLSEIINELSKFYMEELEDLNRALCQDKNNYLALKWRAFSDINRRLNKFINANEDITKEFWFKNVNKAFYGIPKLYCKLHQYNLALKDIHEGILIDSRNLMIQQQSMDNHQVHGNIYRKQHKYEEAIIDFNKSLELYPLPLDMILEHQDGREEGCKVGGGKDGSEDGQDLLVCRNDAGYDLGSVVTQQIFGERNFSRIYYQRGNKWICSNLREMSICAT
ncbi:hypothetical protein Glove_749g6 [Diversispora epigaea]|uniref:Uncharacterized protein n=1 Tax=Diversispora epigaea TaxID=1348612 RepID=A0A397G3T2_9GLOM|nr:hypothetical protein Glove_749g6 [Diversispora epigaea]